MIEVKGLLRTHTCGELRKEEQGQEVTLCGWVNKTRNLGGLHFIDIRDKFGLTQLSFEDFTGDRAELKKAHLESVVMARGKVMERPLEAKNKKMATGEVEIRVTHFEVLSACNIDKLPFLPTGAIESTEDLKLKYRYLDLRTPRLQEILRLRSNVCQKVRQTLIDGDFVEVETPLLFKSTPEGARDYIVPSRVHPQTVYALPQSPQILKQLLMIGSVDRYFQIVKCFRDEDLRAERQPEFTQIDIEASFIEQSYIKKLTEKLLTVVFNLKEDFELKVMSYTKAMELYGTDKPDLRFGLEHHDVTSIFSQSNFKVFSSVVEKEGLIKAIFVPSSMGTFSRKDTDSLTDLVKPVGGKGVAFFKWENNQAQGGISKFLTPENLSALESLAQEKGTWFFFADEEVSVAHACADVVRRYFGETLGQKKDGYHFLWINDFPLMEWDKEVKRFVACHHPFTMSKNSQRHLLKEANPSDPKGVLKEVLAEAYDVICNGHEIGGGSLRIFDSKLQGQMFKALGFTPEEAMKQFGFFIEALEYGTPPHGGIAFGLDRMMMILAKTDSIKDVIAFPKTNSAADLMAMAPSRPLEEQIKELNFKWR